MEEVRKLLYLDLKNEQCNYRYFLTRHESVCSHGGWLCVKTHPTANWCGGSESDYDYARA